MQITYVIPGPNINARENFAALAGLIATARSDDGTWFEVDAPTDEQHPKAFTTRFVRDDGAVSARLEFKRSGKNLGRLEAKRFLNDKDYHKDCLPLVEVIKRLQGKVKHVDHTGVNVPADLSPANWLRAVDFLNSIPQAKPIPGVPQSPIPLEGQLYEYPAGKDGYDPETQLWYFLLQNDPQWQASPRAMTKFELVHDGASPTSLMQIDVQTNLSKGEAAELFPEGSSLPGLSDYFLSVTAKTPWDGARNMRFDLRFKPTNASHEAWSHGIYLMSSGKKVATGQARLPHSTPRIITAASLAPMVMPPARV